MNKSTWRLGIRIVLSLIISFLLILTIFLLRPNCSDKIEGQYYIAHAGGQIGNYNYTNSLEAIQHSLSMGIKFIELDLSLTSDSILVAVHDWELFNQITQNEEKHIPTLKEFKSSKIYGCYTPVSVYDIDSLLADNPDWFLVTDKISEISVIDKFLGKWKNRMCIECFSYEDYQEFSRRGYFLPMFSAVSTNDILIKQRLKKMIAGNDVIPSFFVTGASWYDDCRRSETTLSWWMHLEQSSYALCTLSNRKEADETFSKYPDVHLIYIDNVDVIE